VLPEGKKAPIEATELKVYLLVQPMVIPFGNEVAKLFLKNIAGLFPLALAPQPPCVWVLKPGQAVVVVCPKATELNDVIKMVDEIKVQHINALNFNIFCFLFLDGFLLLIYEWDYQRNEVWNFVARFPILILKLRKGK